MKGRIHVHTERKAKYVRANSDPRLVRRVTAHVERHLGRVDWVFHDLISDVVHLDLLWVPPTSLAGFHTIVTCGMSQQAMPVEDPRCECRYAELLMRLPGSWPLMPNGPMAEATVWPLVELATLARTPHLYDTHFWGGHTVANGEPDGTLHPIDPAGRFCGSLLDTPDWTPSGFRRLTVDRRRKVRFFSVIPLHAEELRLARDHGTPLLLDGLDKAGITDLLDVHRPTAIRAS